jgi:hypothetical protein
LSAKGKNGKKATADQLELLEPDPRVDRDLVEKEYQHMKELYPDEFAQFYEEELAKPSPLPPSNFIRKGAAENIAVTRLKTKHGIVK